MNHEVEAVVDNKEMDLYARSVAESLTLMTASHTKIHSQSHPDILFILSIASLH